MMTIRGHQLNHMVIFDHCNEYESSKSGRIYTQTHESRTLYDGKVVGNSIPLLFIKRRIKSHVLSTSKRGSFHLTHYDMSSIVLRIYPYHI